MSNVISGTGQLPPSTPARTTASSPGPIVQKVNVPGPPGVPGASAYTSVANPFTMPPADDSTTVSAEIEDNAWIGVNQLLFIENAGIMTAIEVNEDGIHVLLVNPGGYGNASPSTSIPMGSKVSPGGHAGGVGMLPLAIGPDSAANGPDSLAVGLACIANVAFSVAMGNSSVANGVASFAIGLGCTTGDYAVAAGEQCNASGNNSVALGYQCVASGNNSTAFGKLCVTSGVASFAVGLSCTAGGDFSVATGNQTTAWATGVRVHSANGAAGASSADTTYFAQDVNGTGHVFFDADDNQLFLQNGYAYTIRARMVATRQDVVGVPTAIQTRLLVHVTGGVATIDAQMVEWTDDPASNGYTVTFFAGAFGHPNALQALLTGVVGQTVNAALHYDMIQQLGTGT